MNGPDLFGHDAAPPRRSLREELPSMQLALLDHAAERAALASGRALSQERAAIIAPGVEDDPFEDEDGPEYVDEGADPDAAWNADALLAEVRSEDPAPVEEAPRCPECCIPATIHGWAAPHGRDGFPCPPGSWE